MDYMRPDIVALLRGSDSSYVRELIGMDPVAVFRWAVLRAAIRAMAVMREAGRLRAERAEQTAGMVQLLPTTAPRPPLGPSRFGCVKRARWGRPAFRPQVQSLNSQGWVQPESGTPFTS